MGMGGFFERAVGVVETADEVVEVIEVFGAF